ncbi:helix-turn-helix transcriptional regulator [Oscillibacter sp. MSJ-2]|uniref:Helix-turn-helix transcriptional regulator n=1 Tax=Dysosmobacter acutus TaxID=2841504 RepID=A0ABS6F8K5_9FIRM|nr:helix-turn-helix transcriptional regulator [Dysosmobacter acutus]MBU5625690.1 helix-turn-helix transcriptional regulator [Dysosmobacter acutus]
MFYDQFYSQCEIRGITPTQVARDIGIRQSTVSMWKKQGTTPKYDTLKKLAEYFGVTVDYLLGKEAPNAWDGKLVATQKPNSSGKKITIDVDDLTLSQLEILIEALGPQAEELKVPIDRLVKLAEEIRSAPKDKTDKE